jgi:CubicO group peptidase (beta-lactamase class C family)
MSGFPVLNGSNDKERVLASCWQAVLEVERVAPGDHFEELGGDSIHAIWIVAAAEKAGLLLSTSAMREHPVLAAQAERAQIVNDTAFASALARVAGAPVEATCPTPTGPEPRWSGVERTLHGFIARGELAGATLVVAGAGGALYRGAFGLAELAPRRPMQLDTPFAIASMSKPFVAVAAMLLVDAGRLSLDDEIGRHLPELGDLRLAGDGRAPRRGPSVRDLLRHTSGILDHDLAPTVETRESFVRRCARRPLHFEPGARWGYSSAAINVAARIVERVAGASIEHFLREALWGPLGMTGTSFLLTEARAKALACTYGQLGAGLQEAPVPLPDDVLLGARDLDTFSPTRGLFSTADDLATFCRMILCGGELDGRRVLSRRAVETMTSLHTGDRVAGFVPGMGWGLGWAVVRDERAFDHHVSRGTFGHAGSRGTQMWVRPREGLVTVLLIQRDGIQNVEGSPLRVDVERAVLEAWSAQSAGAAGGGR